MDVATNQKICTASEAQGDKGIIWSTTACVDMNGEKMIGVYFMLETKVEGREWRKRIYLHK